MKFTVFVLSILAIAVFLVPLLVSAHEINVWRGGYWGPILSCGGGGPGGTDNKRCESLCDLMHTFQHAIYFGISLALFAAAPILFIWGGILILIAGANPGLLEKGKKVLSGTVIGIAIVLGAFLIVNTFLWALGNPTGDWASIECKPAQIPGTLSR